MSQIPYIFRSGRECHSLYCCCIRNCVRQKMSQHEMMRSHEYLNMRSWPNLTVSEALFWTFTTLPYAAAWTDNYLLPALVVQLKRF